MIPPIYAHLSLYSYYYIAIGDSYMRAIAFRLSYVLFFVDAPPPFLFTPLYPRV